LRAPLPLAILAAVLSRTVVYLDGAFVAPDRARVPVTHRGYLHGDGVFATMRAHEGACFRPGEHLATLARGARMLGLEGAPSTERLADLADEAARQTGAPDAYVRVTLARADHGDAAVTSIVARAMDVPSDADYARGIDAVTAERRRIPAECMDPSIKTSSYLPQMLARREAGARGAAEAIQLAIDGSVACGTVSNVFAVHGDVLSTPHLASGCRAGVTRGAVLELARAAGLEVREARFAREALDDADEVFFTSTRVDCLPAARIDGRPVGRGAFPRTRQLREAVHALAVRETRSRRAAP